MPTLPPIRLTLWLSGGAALAVVLALAANAAPQASPPAASIASMTSGAPTQTVKIANFTFDARTLTVPVGATVTWINEDDIPHTVVSSDSKLFRSKVLDTDDRFSFTFTKVGEVKYF